MDIGVWDHSTQLQFIMFNIFVYKYLNINCIKNIFISSELEKIITKL